VYQSWTSFQHPPLLLAFVTLLQTADVKSAATPESHDVIWGAQRQQEEWQKILAATAQNP